NMFLTSLFHYTYIASYLINNKRLEISESTLPGTRFQLHAALDPDGGVNSVQHYKLNQNNNFRLEVKDRGKDGKVPILQLQSPLDREVSSSHRLLLTALDGGKPPKTGTMEIFIDVLDVNDNAPVFTKDIYSAEINENSPIGTTVIRVNATDMDDGLNGDVSYSFGNVNNKVRGLFDVDPSTGEITVKGQLDYEVTSLSNKISENSRPGTTVALINDVPFTLSPSIQDNMYAVVTKSQLDRENKSIYDVTVIAKDAGEPALTSEKTLRVVVSDVNDNSPEFSMSRYNFYVTENNPPGASVFSLIASDRDEGDSALISYHILRDGGYENKDAFFEVNPDNGALQIHKKIDREELCQGSGACLMELKILVENPLEMHHIVVEITDVNDHSPSFPEKEQKFQIAEHTSPGTRFQLHAARDPDAGVNSIRTYTLTANEHFEIEISQSDEDKMPSLVLKKSLDREQKNKHLLFVTAVDGGKPPRSGTLNVSIIVLDVNDNRPMFSQETYPIEIYENASVGTTVTRVNATDPDEGTNGEIEYSLSKALARKVYDIFELDRLSGQIKLKGKLDFEDSEIYKLDIDASDKGTPPLIGGCRVIVKIKDVNDNPPEIEVTSLSNTVSEDSKPGTVISLISVTDKDSGVNGKIISRITNDVPFELKPSYKENIYSVVTKGFLDREDVSHYEIIIKATDCGEPPLSTFKTLSIQISDINDNSPHFEQNPSQFYLVENNVPGTSIFSVSAKDNDVNDNAAISYHIARGNYVTSFLNVNSENGQISALKSFDFETLKTFQFQVVATDSGTPSLSSNVTVNVFILDQNDNAPVILYPVSSNGSAEGVEEIPRNVNAGHLYGTSLLHTVWFLSIWVRDSNNKYIALRMLEPSP
uniref:Cadherin domain-containing protein n=1 Tax=Dicentrarchus labrax TaxID=13489 RepID=A0A8C4H9Y7_DICLA